MPVSTRSPQYTPPHEGFRPSDDLALLAHELRTPLAAIRLLSEALVERHCEAARVRQLGSQMRSISGTLSDTLDSVLDVRRFQSGRVEWETFDLQRQAAEAMDMVRPLAGSLPIRLVGPVGHVLPMTGDASSLRRVIVNLLANSLRHVSVGGILLTLDNFRRRHVWNVITVSDTGCGIDDETLACLRRCGRGACSTHGTGLGLRIARVIVAAHGGAMEIVTAPGQGTTVRAMLRADLKGPRHPEWEPRPFRIRTGGTL